MGAPEGPRAGARVRVPAPPTAGVARTGRRRLSGRPHRRAGRLVRAVLATAVITSGLVLVLFDVLAGPATRPVGKVATKEAAVVLSTVASAVGTSARTGPLAQPPAQPPVQPVAQPMVVAARGIVSAVQAGLALATIKPVAGVALLGELRPLLGAPLSRAAELSRFDTLAQMIYDGVTDRSITGSASIGALTSGLASLGLALGTAVPYPSLALVPEGRSHMVVHRQRPGVGRNS